MSDELSGIETVEGIEFSWTATGVAKRHTVTVSHPDYGRRSTQIGGQSIIELVQTLARELMSERPGERRD